MFSFLERKKDSDPVSNYILPHGKQIGSWRKASRRMKWGIREEEFASVGPPPDLTSQDLDDGYIGAILSYGFGEEDRGHSDAVLSGRRAWSYACRRRGRKTWQCRYIDFHQADHFRLRPGAPLRPRGFYYAKFRPGDSFLSMTVASYLKQLKTDTGCGPEGIQLLTITHPHLAERMNRREIAFMAMADYDVAPHGFNDFFDALQMFCSNGILGLGIGNVDQNYPLFGIPSLRFTPA